VADSDGVGVGEVEIRWQVQPAAADAGRGALLVHGPLAACWGGTVADLPARGFLVADLHGGVLVRLAVETPG
jgi:hypothetical protein